MGWGPEAPGFPKPGQLPGKMVLDEGPTKGIRCRDQRSSLRALGPFEENVSAKFFWPWSQLLPGNIGRCKGPTWPRAVIFPEILEPGQNFPIPLGKNRGNPGRFGTPFCLEKPMEKFFFPSQQLPAAKPLVRPKGRIRGESQAKVLPGPLGMPRNPFPGILNPQLVHPRGNPGISPGTLCWVARNFSLGIPGKTEALAGAVDQALLIGMIRWARSLMMRRSGVTSSPLSCSSVISPNRTPGSMITPLPIMQVFSG